MNSPNDKERELRRRQRELEERERAIRLRELEAEINQIEPPVYQTTHHTPQKPRKLTMKKLANIGKFFALVVVTVISLKIASWLTGVIIVAGIAGLGYVFFFKSENRKS
ncbi:hypothetical protein [Microseira wollei]|uniref:DUF3040 domain-containing protein n=1 Tax=Microseira wollei NIES-4236 TaxID=2530354 RepID=A0AAV3X755_9CYAN|nr:hypothetical protein [Microseira wollei]GET36446.1 hypothetical protein MiSe_11970 [Microseira wollei NIES-4236]